MGDPDECMHAGSEESGYEITRDFVVAMLEHFKAQKVIHRRFAFQIILQACASRPCTPHVLHAPALKAPVSCHKAPGMPLANTSNQCCGHCCWFCKVTLARGIL